MIPLAQFVSDAICAASGLTAQDFSVSIGDRNDKATWRLDLISDVSPDIQDLAQAALDSFVV